MKERTHVYFMQEQRGGSPAEDLVKIGCSKNVEARRVALQSYDGVALLVRATFPGTRAQERKLHTLFAAHRVQGEWFRPCPEILYVIESGLLPPLPDVPCNPGRLTRLSLPLTEEERERIIDLKSSLQKDRRTLKEFVMGAIWQRMKEEKGHKK